jgi:hypothetical protein
MRIQKPIYQREILRLRSPVEVANSWACVIVKVALIQNIYWIHSPAFCCLNCRWFCSPVTVCNSPWKNIDFGLNVKILRF